jgi:transposase
MNYKAQRAALDDQRNAEIDRLAAAGLSKPEIARTIGCSYAAVYNYLHPEGRERKRLCDERRRRLRVA